MGNIKSKKVFKPVKLSTYRLDQGENQQDGHVFIEKDFSDIIKDRQVLISEAKEYFHKGNDNFRACNYEQAKYCYMEALEKIQLCDSTIRNHSFDEMTQGSEGIINYSISRYFKAKHLIEKANEILQDTCTSMICASEALRQAIVSKTVPLKEKILAIQLKEHGALDSMFADLMNNLAACYELSGDLENAKKLYEDSMKLRKVSYGPRSLKAAESMQNLATIYDSLGHLSLAEHLLTQALNIEKEELGMDNIQVTVSMNNLGLLKAHMGEWDEALTLLEKTVQIRMKHFGEDHHLTRCAALNLDFTKKQRSKATAEQIQASLDAEKLSPLVRNNGYLEPNKVKNVQEEFHLRPSRSTSVETLSPNFIEEKSESVLEGDFSRSRNTFLEERTIGGPDWHRFSQDTDIDESLDSESHGHEEIMHTKSWDKPKKDFVIKSFKPFEGRSKYDEVIEMDSNYLLRKDIQPQPPAHHGTKDPEQAI